MKSRESCLQSEKVNPVILQKKKKKIQKIQKILISNINLFSLTFA